ncbi:MAG: glucosyltransferase domain-containing protein [Treponema sp.]|nr:glucosyltransferase domain-containing protein [Treponema sp.]
MAAFVSVLWTDKGMSIFNNLIACVKNEASYIVKNKKYFIFLAALYFLGYFTIIINNFCYISADELPRQMEGYRHWVTWFRYIDEIGSIFIHTTPRLLDIAPLTQFIAIFFVALASFLTVQAASFGSMTYLACFASLPIGLIPYFMADVAYRYDSPYMAFSIFACVIPFVFRKETSTFVITSFLGLLTMCMSYQASNGIYIILSAFFALKMIQDNESWKKILKFLAICMACYIVSLVFFKLTFIGDDYNPGRLDERMQAGNILKNAIQYITLIWQGLGKSGLKMLMLLSIALNLFIQAYFSKRNKVLTFVFILLFYVLTIPLSFGAYLAMNQPLWHPRAMYGIGFFLAIVLIMLRQSALNANKFIARISCVLIIATSYCCIVFCLAFGNAQFTQNQYAEYRVKLIANDLSKIIPQQNNDKALDIAFANELDFAPAVKNLIRTYPLAADLVDKHAAEGACNLEILKSLGFLEFEGDKENNSTQYDSLPVLVETSFHKIQGQDNIYYITYKTDPVKVADY